MNILLKNASAFLPDGSVKATDIAISGQRIAKVGTPDGAWRVDRAIDASRLFAIPGLVNAHTHVSMTLLRSYADDMSLMDWLENKIWPVEAKMHRKDIYWGAMLAALEMIRTGTTCFADMYACMEDVAEVAVESGLRGVLARGMIGNGPTGEKAFAENETLFRDYHGAADGRVTVMFGPHAPYTCSPEFLRRVAGKAKSLGAEVHIHLAETKGEVADCLRDHGKTPVALMDECGILDCGVLAAHCVHVSDEDIALMARKRVRVAHNPGSNMKLASGVAPVPKMLKAGLVVGLGTDGASSNNNLDMLEEVRLAALLHKVDTLDPLAIPATTALDMATRQGALAVGLPNVGRIAEGALADLTLYNAEGFAWTPRFDLASLLVYSANSSAVDTVIVDGKILMEHGEILTLDEERILREVNACAAKLTQ